MNDKLLILVALLSKYSDENKDELITFFKKIVKDDSVFKDAILKLDTTIFYHNKGEDVYNQLVKLVNMFSSDINNVLKNRELLKNKLNYLDDNIKRDKGSFMLCEAIPTKLNFVSKDDEILMSTYYKSFINILIYLIFVLMDSNMEYMEYPRNDNSSNLNDIIRDKMLPEFLNNNKKMLSWIVKPTYKVINDYKITQKYELQYTNLAFLDMFNMYSNKQIFSPTMFYNLSEDIVVGVGNIVSFECKDSISFLNSNFVRNIPLFEYKHNFILSNNPIHNLKWIMQNNNFIIKPEDYVRFLNLIVDSKEVLRRLENHKCFICGTPIREGTVCEKHKIKISE